MPNRNRVGETSVSNYTHETVPTNFVEANGVRYAHRRLGKAGTIPLLFLEYFNSNMDGWDPAVTNSLARDHEVILYWIGPQWKNGFRGVLLTSCLPTTRSLTWKPLDRDAHHRSLRVADRHPGCARIRNAHRC